MTTPADELKAAADKLRKHATAAETKRPGRWYPGAAGSVICPRKGGVDYVTPHTIPDGAEVARYIAVMGPDVGHALADWLDHHANILTAATQYDPDSNLARPALAVARALNGDAR
ncbi:hypothetical protein ACFWV1_13060 [Streptomyces sp. NPDC058700]|uniref:hypothetical protein n=1 Tax=Streptomyces sp. NPDC058700 TaxID=3346607 RepID=UPI00364E4C19